MSSGYVAYTTSDGRRGFVNEERIIAIEKSRADDTVLVIDTGVQIQIQESPDEFVGRIYQMWVEKP